MSRVAVLGVPRGGTTLAVGLLRILGYRLPDADPCCLLGESRRLRWADSPLHDNIPQLACEIDALPDGVVWKDPTVAMYAAQIDWSEWTVIRVIRDPHSVAASEQRWLPDAHTPVELIERARQWASVLDAVPAALRIGVSVMRARPVHALQMLAHATADTHPMEDALERATAFIRAEGGYHCPRPGACGLREAAHSIP